MIDNFVFSLIAGLGISLQTAPLGCIAVWQHQGGFAKSIAHRGLLGTPANIAFAAGLVTVLIAGAAEFNVRRYLLGDVFTVSSGDLWWIFVGLIGVGGAMTWLWRPLLAIGVHEDIAAAEGLSVRLVRIAYMLLVALSAVLSMKVVGLLPFVAMLGIPALAARTFASTPEQMLASAAVISATSILTGIAMAWTFHLPAGSFIVFILISLWLAASPWRLRKNRA